MTTPAETIAEAIRDGFHELATAVQGWDSAGTATIAPGAHDSPSRGESDGRTPAEPSQDVVERAARVLADTAPHLSSNPEEWMEEAQALADAGLLAEDAPDCPDATPGFGCGWKTTISQIAAACNRDTPQDADQAEALIAYIEALHETSEDGGPMTVGQLGAQHIGKQVSIDGDRPITISRIHHLESNWTWVDHYDGNRTSGHPDTPCTVEN